MLFLSVIDNRVNLVKGAVQLFGGGAATAAAAAPQLACVAWTRNIIKVSVTLTLCDYL